MSDEVTELPTKLNRLTDDAIVEAQTARRARKAHARVFSVFDRAMREAMDMFHRFRAQGVSREDAIKGLELVVRDVWPKHVTRYPPKCDACDDTGYEDHVCRQYVRCERLTCQAKGDDWQHRYVTPCSCQMGDRYRPKVYTPDEASAGLGKVSKPQKGWSRIGATR